MAGARFPQPGALLLLIHSFAWNCPSPLHLGQSGQVFSQPELGPISRMLAEPGVTDLVVNGHQHASVLVGGRWRGIPSGFDSEADLATAAKLLIALGGRQVDQAHPFGNVDLNGRLRVHVLLGSQVNNKTHISIRVHVGRKVALEQLQQIGMITESQLANLRLIVERRESFLISGSAGVGKTTFLRAMLDAVAGERIITIEDVAELQLESNDHVALVKREANLEGAGAISLQQLLIEALRMRPDRIVVGEVRSLELLTLLQAANTGHCVAASIHANSTSQIRERISSIAISQGVSGEAANGLLAESIDCFIHLTNREGRRSIEIRSNNE